MRLLVSVRAGWRSSCSAGALVTTRLPVVVFVCAHMRNRVDNSLAGRATSPRRVRRGGRRCRRRLSKRHRRPTHAPLDTMTNEQAKRTRCWRRRLGLPAEQRVMVAAGLLASLDSEVTDEMRSTDCGRSRPSDVRDARIRRDPHVLLATRSLRGLLNSAPLARREPRVDYHELARADLYATWTWYEDQQLRARRPVIGGCRVSCCGQPGGRRAGRLPTLRDEDDEIIERKLATPGFPYARFATGSSRARSS